METVTEDTYSNLMLIIRRSYMSYTVICLTYPTEWKLETVRNLFVIHIKPLRQVLDHGLIPEKVQRLIDFNQELWLKSYICMKTELRTKAKNDFWKEFFELLNNLVFEKTVENVRKYRDITLVANNTGRCHLMLELNYHIKSSFQKFCRQEK